LRSEDVSDALRELANACGVATEYYDWRNEHVTVKSETLHAVLAALDVDTADPEAALAARQVANLRRLLPPCVVVREGQAQCSVQVHVNDGASVDVWVTLEDGSYHSNLRQLENHTAPRELDGRWIGEASFAVPADLPIGYHELHASSGGEQRTTSLIVTPAWLPAPQHKLWGLATQLYSVRSRRSWGVGDLTDLAELATWAATEHDAGFVLVNPMHAAEPIPPLTASPYLPSSRRYANPLYLRIDRIPEYAQLDATERAAVDAIGTQVDNDTDLIDRDAAWTAKRQALQLIHRHGREPGRELAYRAFRRREAQPLRDFAAWCALAEAHGTDWRNWPAHLQHPRTAQVAAYAEQHRSAVDFHCWLQWLLDEQYAGTLTIARTVGMALGIVHDLAVGVSRSGADAWAWQDEFARGISVGAPPDAYAQTGQDWEQPPWRPDRLETLGYAPFRDLIRAALRHSGGLRVDHIIGLFRLWWIPDGAHATDGTYVRYDHDALVGILALEAARAGAVIIGEDLGTVEPWVRDYLRTRGVFGTSVLWFEFDYDGGGGPLVPERWREYCLASVTTHDLPPTSGYLAGDHVRLRNDLGLLTRTIDEELDADRTEQAAWLDAMRERGLLAPDADTDAIVLALHRALTFTPARLRCLALTDAVGDRRTQNQPGATSGYPNWQVPLSGPDGRPLLLEEIFTNQRAADLAETIRIR
jgi:4-alpha-glucanotransferase